ncbi:MAG TPA: HAMP domain-containing sensor histidine kinase [Gaiellaceae bacterium]|nr:HAMP domain-containing sensor histidine kinase [Gaiellaceae bacterium]
MLGRLSLRARLLLGVIAVAAAGLAIADVATYTSLSSFLVSQTDGALEDSHSAIEHEVGDHGCGDGGQVRGTSPGDYIEVVSAGGRVLCERPITVDGELSASQPELPADLAERVASLRPGEAAYLTVHAKDGGGRYRVRASPDYAGGDVLVVARSLDGVDATLGRLLRIELLVTALVLACLGLLGLWVVDLGLRPLSAIGATASAIAGGDLSRRVERAEPRTEVGRLGLALNAMLARIEAAFNAQAASEQRLRRFVADASHELRTPLAAVRAYAELFSRGASQRPGDLERSMRGITRESERMTELVEDLLLLARLDEGRPLEREPLQLERVVDEAVETARTVDPDRPITVVLEPARVVGDRTRLRQVMDNLLGNVRAHTPAGAPVDVRVTRSNGNAVVAVVDSGPGLRDGDAARVFERFYRADESRSRSSGGAGLGLSIVAAVSEAHGGAVTASSAPGGGATFEVSIPLAPSLSADSQASFRRSLTGRGSLAATAERG